jgi:hypothetical protein
MTDNQLPERSRTAGNRLRRDRHRRTTLTAKLTTPPNSSDPPPEPLFERIGETDYRCTRCGATNTCEADSFPSFGGTTDWWEHCTACGTTVSGCNMSAVL